LRERFLLECTLLSALILELSFLKSTELLNRQYLMDNLFNFLQGILTMEQIE
jgi:hypothetical protein